MSEEDTKAPEVAAEEETAPDASAEEPAKEEESTANFEPVIQLEEVEVKSGEEEENVIYTKRGKLFVFGETLLDKGTGTKSWRERGVGEMRLLCHRESGHIRTLMRQEKTMKVICNHQVDPRIELSPNAGSDRSWVWRAFDFSDGAELIETTFAVRFGDSEVAKEFKDKFEECQEKMKKFVEGADDPGGDDGKAGDEAAEALAGLTTKDSDTKPANDGEAEAK